eukprot:4904730-Pleurochrysis_carterae.AAC.2
MAIGASKGGRRGWGVGNQTTYGRITSSETEGKATAILRAAERKQRLGERARKRTKAEVRHS